MDIKKDIKWKVFLPAIVIIIVAGVLLLQINKDTKGAKNDSDQTALPTAAPTDDGLSVPVPDPSENEIKAGLPETEDNAIVQETAGSILGDIDDATLSSDEDFLEEDFDLDDLDLDF